MRRREFIAGLGGAAVVGPRATLGQQMAMPVIGFLHTGASQSYAQQMAAFHRGLGELGYVPGRNVMIDHRWAENRLDRLPALAADLVRKRVNVIAPAGGPAAVSAAIAATGLIPIVFSLGSDPVRLGFVPSLNRPGGNVTGVVFLTNDLEAKRMELLCEMLPGVHTIGYLVNPTNPNANAATNGVQAAARILGRQLFVVQAGVDGDFDAAIKTLVEHRADALLVSPDALFTNRTKQLASSTLSARLPAIDQLRGFPAAGGLASYGADLLDTYRQHGIYVGRILKGDKPGELPVMQPVKFELVINLKTAKVLGLTVPPKLLFTADEVLE
jgi:putative tryptophan/tyrosine transport system substrate-binding protein